MSEGYESFYPIDFNEAVNFIRAHQAIMAVEIAREAKEGVEKLEKRIDALEERIDRLEKVIVNGFKEIRETIRKLSLED